MRKSVIAAVVVVIVIAAAAVFIVTRLDYIVAGLIESEGSKATQTAVRVDGVSIDLGDASASLSGLSVANPAGFDGAAIDLGGFQVRIDPRSLTSDTIVLEEVVVSDARLDILQQGARNNLRELLANLSAGQSGDAPDSAGGKKLIIDRFVLENASASVTAPDIDEQREVSLPTIELGGIGRESGGATGAEVARQILEPVIERALRSAAVESLKQKAKDKVDEVTDRVFDGLRDKLGGDDEKETPEQ